MAFPYSDNMYSMDDSGSAHHQADDGLTVSEDGDEDRASEYNAALSPSDGYFRGASSGVRTVPSSGAGYRQEEEDPYSASPHQGNSWLHSNPSNSYAAAASSNVPHVPDVWVSDPSLEQGSTAENKAREAREERDRSQNQNIDTFNRYPSTAPSEAATAFPSSAATASHRAHNNHQPSFSNTPSGHTRSSPSVASSSNYYQPSTHYPSRHQHTPSSSSHASRSQRGGPLYTERSSLFSTPNEAPPAYTPSPTSPASASASEHHSPARRTYQTFPQSIMGRSEESERLLAGHQEPQSMGEPDDELVYSAWRERVNKRMPYLNWRNCRLAGLALVLLLVTVGFLVSSIVSVKDEKNNLKSPSTSPGAKMPVNDGVKLAYPPYDGEMPWEQGRFCNPKQIKYPLQTFKLDYAANRNLSFFQDIQSDNQPAGGTDVRISGDLVIRRSGSGTPEPSITLEVVSNDDSVNIDLRWDPDAQRMVMLTPLKVTWADRNTLPCLQVRATIWAPAGSQLETLNVENVHLGIKLLDNLSLQMTHFARLASTVGTIVGATDGEKDLKTLMHEGAPSSFTFDSRYIEIKTTSNSIQGSWPLYDYLGLESISGTIHAGVEPKAALPDKPRPAILYVHSTSGSVEVWEPIHAAQQVLMGQQQAPEGMSTLSAEEIMPPRNYGVDLYTMSGTIKGSVAFGYSCKVHTTSGSVSLDLLPVLDRYLADTADVDTAKRYVELETSTTSGTTTINVLEPVWANIEEKSYARVPQASTPPTAATTPTPPTPPTPPIFLPAGDDDPYLYLGAHPPVPAPDAAPAEEAATVTEQQALMRAALRVLRSRHASTSASIRVHYPSAWEGDIEVDSLTGSLNVGGQGVEIIRRKDEWPGYHSSLLARKGPDGGGRLVVHTTSGSVTAQIGD